MKCEFTHIFPSKLKVHYNIVHLGIKRQDEKNTCKTLSCEHFGKTTCKDLETHSLFSCEHCQFSARRKHLMRDHVEKVHEGIIHPCQKCPFVAKTGDTLRTHMKTQHHIKIDMKERYQAEKPNKCNQCSSRPTDLKSHMIKHAGGKPYNCNQCNYASFWPGGLKNHMIKHTGEKPYNCNQCSNVYASANTLRYHIKTHSEDRANGVKPFKCTHCDSSYFTSNGLRKHSEKHEGNLYKCNQCEYTSPHISNLQRHMRVSHLGVNSQVQSM